jgi:L-amino acid N-acyltransferase YncA
MTPQSQVLAYMKAGNALTVQDCLRLFRTTELRRIVSRLKSAGNIIGGVTVEENGSRFKRYHYIGERSIYLSESAAQS